MIGQWYNLMYEEQVQEQSKMSIIDNINLNTTPKNQHDYILLDRSGSMASKWSDTLGGVNAYVHQLASDPVTKDILVTVVLFDSHNGQTVFDVIRRSLQAKHWEDILLKEASPRGWTPLYDAVGQLVSLAFSDNPEKSAIVIVTDGQENHSKEHNQASAKALLDTCRKRDWQVLFLGADFDNFKQSQSLGVVDPGHTHSYGSHELHEGFASAGSTRAYYSTSTGNMSVKPSKK